MSLDGMIICRCSSTLACGIMSITRMLSYAVMCVWDQLVIWYVAIWYSDTVLENVTIMFKGAPLCCFH
jgi:hypothetical protein